MATGVPLFYGLALPASAGCWLLAVKVPVLERLGGSVVRRLVPFMTGFVLRLWGVTVASLKGFRLRWLRAVAERAQIITTD